MLGSHGYDLTLQMFADLRGAHYVALNSRAEAILLPWTPKYLGLQVLALGLATLFFFPFKTYNYPQKQVRWKFSRRFHLTEEKKKN